MPADPEDEGKRPSTLDPEHLQNATNLWKQIKFKGIVHPEIKPHLITNLYEFLSSFENKDILKNVDYQTVDFHSN